MHVDRTLSKDLFVLYAVVALLRILTLSSWQVETRVMPCTVKHFRSLEIPLLSSARSMKVDSSLSWRETAQSSQIGEVFVPWSQFNYNLHVLSEHSNLVEMKLNHVLGYCGLIYYLLLKLKRISYIRCIGQIVRKSPIQNNTGNLHYL